MKNTPRLFFIYTILISSVFIYSIIEALPTTPISTNKNINYLFTNVIPQGWGFFSKDPRSPTIDAINLEGDLELSWPNMSIDNFFGISRLGRGQGIELGTLKSKADQSKIKSCEPLTDDCLNNVEFTEVENTDYKNQTICGKWLILEKEPLPWAWSDQYNKTKMNSTVYGVDVVCSQNSKKD